MPLFFVYVCMGQVWQTVMVAKRDIFIYKGQPMEFLVEDAIGCTVWRE